MARRAGLSQWTAIVSRQLPHLSGPQAAVLALWSYGIVLAQCCGLTTVTALLAGLLDASEPTVRQRLREWSYAAADKRGDKRQAVEVSTCFAPLLRWVLAWWAADERQVVLALDASALAARFTVLAISVVYRGCAIPVAWVVLPGNRTGAWRPHWERLLAALAGAVPPEWPVLVQADRGLYARWLFRAIQARGWHPFLRINLGGQVRPAGRGGFLPLRALGPPVGGPWCGRVTCFATPDCQLACTLLARRDAGSPDPWLILTDLTPEVAEAVWYGRRSWIAQGFKEVKRGGWQWQRTRMTDPDRGMRLWLALAGATLWVVSVGGAAEATVPASSLDRLPATHIARRTHRHRRPPRLLSGFRRGVLTILTALLRGDPLPLGRFLPAPWPTAPPVWQRISVSKSALAGMT